MKKLIPCFLILTACNYHTIKSDNQYSVGIPFITGDKDGSFSKILAQELSGSGVAHFASRNTRYEIHAKIINDASERIGFRYDRFADGELRPNLVGTETRRNITCEVELVDTIFDKVVFGPKVFTSHSDYDYQDTDNIIDMSFVDPAGQRVLGFSYSLGQLNTVEGSQDVAIFSTYRSLSKKITDELALFLRDEN